MGTTPCRTFKFWWRCRLTVVIGVQLHEWARYRYVASSCGFNFSCVDQVHTLASS